MNYLDNLDNKTKDYFEDENNKLFKKVSMYLGQWKINGLRCYISAYKEEGMFGEIRLQFQSREGTIWNSLKALEYYLLTVIPDYFLNKIKKRNEITHFLVN